MKHLLWTLPLLVFGSCGSGASDTPQASEAGGLVAAPTSSVRSAAVDSTATDELRAAIPVFPDRPGTEPATSQDTVTAKSWLPEGDLHDNDPAFPGPAVPPPPPSPNTDPIGVAEWIAVVLTNTEPDQTLDLDLLKPLFDPALLADYRSSSFQLIESDVELASHGLIVDSRLEQTTSTLAVVLVTVERTFGVGIITQPGFDLVTFHQTLIHDGNRWVLAGLQVSRS